MIHRQSSWRRREDIEWATLKWVDWFNNRRLLEPIGNIPSAEAEAAYYSQVDRVGKTVAPEDGLKLPFGKLVLATGSRPRLLTLPDERVSGAPNPHCLRPICLSASEHRTRA